MFHWALVISITGSWITAEINTAWFDYHFLLGYTALGLVLFRLIWGFVGTRFARFSQFVRGPSAAVEEARGLFNRSPGHTVGHGAIGGWSTLLLLLLVAVQATTGLFITDDVLYVGPYNGTVSSGLAGTLAEIHHTNFTILQGVVVLHIVAALWYQFGKRTPLISAMLSGRRETNAALPALGSYWLRAAIVIAISAAAVVFLVQLAPEPEYLYF